MNNNLKQIDLTPLIGSQVLCEFSEKFDDGTFSKEYDFLQAIEPQGYLPASDDAFDTWSDCRIYQHPDYWISNADGKLVLPDGLMVNLQFPAHRMEWPNHILGKGMFQHDLAHPMNNVMAVQVTGLADGYTW